MDGPMSKFRFMNMNCMPVGAELEKIESDALHLLDDTIQGFQGNVGKLQGCWHAATAACKARRS
eukprot:366070-Chlamydomonas_euryale.AAC.3